MTSYFDFDATCGTSYKICDYRPFFGEIYKEYTKGYDFWGWCDTDIILGNIRKFISDNVLNEYSKINYSPHFSLIKNDGVINIYCLIVKFMMMFGIIERYCLFLILDSILMNLMD